MKEAGSNRSILFALVPLEGSPAGVNLTCDPEPALELRARHPPGSVPVTTRTSGTGNTVELGGSADDDELRWMVEHSHVLVVAGLPRSVRGRFHNI